MAPIKRSIKIYARLKPLNTEPTGYEIDTVNNDDTNDEILTLAWRQNQNEDLFYSGNKPETYKFRYQKVLDRNCRQEDVFNTVAKPVVDSALQGYNGTIFAYGQTGSGKTFSMTGSRTKYNDRGIIPRALSYVFEKFHEYGDASKIQAAFVSYLEIYNECGYDLLQTHNSQPGNLEDLGKVSLMEDGNQQLHLKNLTVHPVGSEEEALQLLYLGDHNRTIAETPMNEASTRSHCIFTIHLNLRDTESSVVRRSKIHLVDLAGSERIAHSNISGQLLTEARHINLALHYLEQVIVALGESNRTHIPYRNSMMTSILRDSLGGNCMTTMIATLSLEPRNIQESLSTCRFSQRVALVTNAAILNEEVDPNILIQQLKAEVKRLKEIIATAQVKPLKENADPLTPEEIKECSNLVAKFLKDKDDQAILPVPPDMRKIQACFRLLKVAVDPSKCAKSLQMIKAISEGHIAGSQVELLKTIQNRDQEIKVLVKTLKNERAKRSQNDFESKAKMAGLNPESQLSARSNASDGNSIESILSKPAYKEDDDGCIQDLVSTKSMSEFKRLALSEFLENYSGKDKLNQIRESFFKKKEEIQQIEEQMNQSHGNMRTLKSAIIDEAAGESSAITMKSHEDYVNMAVESQKVTLKMQEERLTSVKKQMEETGCVLKALYTQLIEEFEEWWRTTGKEKSEILVKDVVEPSMSSKSDSSDFKSVAKKSEVETKSGHSSYRLHTPSKNRVRWSDLEDCDALAKDGAESSKELARQKSAIGSRGDEIKVTAGKSEDIFSWKADRYPPSPSPPPTTPVASKNCIAHHVVTEDEMDDEEELKNLPRTGDPETDNEILAFFRARQKVLKQLSLRPVTGVISPLTEQ